MVLLEEWTRKDGDVAPGPSSSAFEVAQSAFRSAWYADNANARTVAIEEAYDKRIDDVFKATGIRLANPLRRELPAPDNGRNAAGETLPFRIGPNADNRRRPQPFFDLDEMRPALDRFQGELTDLAGKHPDHAGIIKSEVSPLDDARGLARTATQNAADALALYHGPWGTGTVASFAGSMAGGLNDPLNDAMLALGPTGRAGLGLKGLLWNGIKQAGANAAGAAAAQPFVAQWHKEAGLGYDAGDFAQNVGSAAALGFAGDVGIRGLSRGVKHITGQVPILDAKGGVAGWESKEQGLDRAARKSAEPLLKKAANMEASAAELRQLAEHTGADRDPVLRATLDALEDVEATSTRRPHVDEHASDWAETQTARALMDDDEPLPAAPRDEPLVLYRGEGPTDPLRRQNRRGEWYTTDLERAIGYAAGDNARGVLRVEVPPDRVGELKPGLTPDELVVPLDLHAKARPVDMETAAARHAVASGELDAGGAAAALREHPDALDSATPRQSETMQQAIAVSRLAAPARDMVLTGAAEAKWGALVQRLVPDKTQQASVLRELALRNPGNDADARYIVNTVADYGRRSSWEADRAAGRGLDDPMGEGGRAQLKRLEHQLQVPEVLDPQLRPVVDMTKGEAVGLGLRAGIVEAKYRDAVATVRLAGKEAIIEALDAKPVGKRTGLGAGQGEATLLVRMIAREADERGVTLKARLSDAEQAEGATAQFLNAKLQRGIYRLYGFRGDTGELYRRPSSFRAASGWREADKVPHPEHPKLLLPVDADGNVRFYRGEKPGQDMKGHTDRIFTTNEDKARKFAGAEGTLHEAVLPPERLKEAVPRGATTETGLVRPGDDMFVLSRRAADEVVKDKAARDVAEAALDAVPEAGLAHNLDQVDALERMRDLIENCKL